LRTASGAVVGTLCVADPQARLVTEKHSAMLEDLAFSVSTSLELVKTVRQMHNQGGALELELGRKLRRLHDNVEELEQWGHKLEESHEKLSHFLSSGSDVLWETDPDLRIVSAKGFSGVEWNENSFIGQRLAETLGAYIEHNSEAKLLVEQLETRQPFRDITFVHSLGEERTRWLEASANPVFTSTGTFRGYRGTFRDITRRKEDEARISFLARHDVLTRLPNRTVLRERIEHALAQSHRGGHFAVHWLDLDRFKAITIRSDMQPATGCCRSWEKEYRVVFARSIRSRGLAEMNSLSCRSAWKDPRRRTCLPAGLSISSRSHAISTVIL